MKRIPPPPPKAVPASDVLSGRKPWELCVGECADVMRRMPAASVHTVVTSPPYWALRNYHNPGQIGWEGSPDIYASRIVLAMREVKRVLRKDGTLWLNIGDSFGFGPNRGLHGVPWRVALAMMDDGWTLRSEVIWFKTKHLPEPVKDRPMRSHEQIFLFTKSKDYYFDDFAVRDPGEEPGTVGAAIRSVWPIPTSNYAAASHFAIFPDRLPSLCIEAGTSAHGVCSRCGAPWTRVVERLGNPQPGHHCPDRGATDRNDLGLFRDERGHVVWGEQDGSYEDRWFSRWKHAGWEQGCMCSASRIPAVVLDPFAGSGTTLVSARRLMRRAIGIELSEGYAQEARDRIRRDFPLGEVSGKATGRIGPPSE